ncbi:MAG: hypothetical protein ACR2QC_09400 [Gammaproteobacteria bacterium]
MGIESATRFHYFVAVGYAPGDAIDASAAACADTSFSCFHAVSFGQGPYHAVFTDLTIPDYNSGTDYSGSGPTQQAAIDAARANADSGGCVNCQCVISALDITANAVPVVLSVSYTPADASDTTHCDTVLQPVILPANNAECLAADSTQPIHDPLEPDNCRPLQDSDCLAMTGVGGQEVNNGVCECPAGEMENNAGDMCVLDDASCNAMVAGQVSNDGVCECPAGEMENNAGDMCVLDDASCSAMITGQVSNDGICECPAGSGLNPGGTACELTDEICEARVSGQTVVGGVCQCPAGERVNGGGDRCEEIPTQQQPITSPAAPVGSGVVAERDDGAKAGALMIGGMAAVGIASYFFWDGNPSAFSFSPDYGYSLTESGYAYNIGGRLDFRQDDFHSYYAIGRANSNGDFGDLRYESGGEYTADFWTAAFSETVQGETADWRFSLSADYNGEIWRLSPTYRLHSRLEDDEEFETQNSLNLEGILRYNRWTISPSAGFNWRRPEEFGDNARFNLSAVRRF